MTFLISLIINAAVLLLTAKMLNKVHITSWASALGAALLIGILNPTIGWLLNAIFNVATLGIFLLFGLGFLVRLVVLALILKFVDWIMSGLRIEGFGTALLIAVIMALVGSLIPILL